MKFRLYPLCIYITLLSPMGVQSAFALKADSLSIIQPQSLDTLTTTPQDSIAPIGQKEVLSQRIDSVSSADSVLVMEVQTQPSVAKVVARPMPGLMASWRKNYPLASSKGKAIGSAYDNFTRSALFQSLDTVSPDRSLSYAQRDLRLPIILDAEVPATPSNTLFKADNKGLSPWPGYSYLEAFTQGVNNPFSRQLEYGAMRGRAMFGYAIHHLNSVALMRPENYDLPTERRRIARQELTGQEQVETVLALELEPSGLNIEQVTFHADKWHRRGTTDLQISQTALSDNWYKGGENNMTISNYDKLVFSRYDESMKSTFDLTFELRLSGYYSKADTIHPMRVNDNQFRIDLSYGYKAWKNWFYSTSAYLTTPVFEFYSANSRDVKSAFFSPMELNLAIGMDLKQTQKKRYSYSFMFAPLSYNVKSVSDDRVSVTSYGIKEGHHSLHQFGSSITGKLEWKMSESVNWTSRAYFFTSYHNTKLEFENTFNLTLGRYSSAKVYLYPRFDDGVDNEVQMKEILTFGLAFNW